MSAKLISVLLVVLTLAPAQGRAQESPHQTLFDGARDDWDAGRFIQALEAMESLLVQEPGAEIQNQIALLTGEIFPVTELTVDGRSVRWGLDGRFAAFESGAGSETMTYVLEIGGTGARQAASVMGSGLVFGSSIPEIAYLAVPQSPDLTEAVARIEEEFGGSDRASRMRLRTELAQLNARHTVVRVRKLADGEEREIDKGDLAVTSLFFGPGNGLYLVGSEPGAEGESNIFRVRADGSAAGLTEGPGQKTDPFFAAGGSLLVYTAGRGSFGIREMATGEVHNFQGSAPVLSADGQTLAYLGGADGGGTLNVLSLTPVGIGESFEVLLPFTASTSSTRACPACPPQGGLSLSPDGAFAVVQARPREDWELFMVPLAQGQGRGDAVQLTREIQHDLYPTILPGGRLLAMKGEGRHRRSHLYDLETGEKIWLFRNNTVRTVAPEYEWAPNPEGTKLLLVAERDGNTVSPERGVYLMDLSRTVTREDLLARIRTNLEAERDLLARAKSMYGPIADDIGPVVDGISMSRMFAYQEDLFQFGSKNVSQPGNQQAIEYIAEKLREFGYDPEMQWFDARGVQSANLVARIAGTVSPDVVYAVSAHFDSNNRSPGADDNTSATVGLLEMARVLADHPMPATIEIALFTGEESGLLGSREYVRRSVESGKKLVGALNNDMVGFAEDHRLDNTIRYSNSGIRDVQHGAAILFSEMVTHDAEYYKSTDAAAYYDAYGDIVGGIGSYPILASPHYHQSHDVLETINHKLVTEVSKMSTASVMLLASSPSRLGGLEAVKRGGSVEVRWTPAVESDVTAYRVAFGPEEDPFQYVVEVTGPEATLGDLPVGTVISVKAINNRGMEGWDWVQKRVGG